ncbi:hypothetical protein [Candidatus Burkholderia verschuerenii]|uniref:hypothetical protein n=1 Tax=Candidatus Burkholderia verschuerenii TaxID=242163 RepID=UPI00067ADB37|nr:hypothetical protein [Candidatus Burkholderia verschuerenii]
MRCPHSIGANNGNIIAVIIASHMAMKSAAARSQVLPQSRVHIVDSVQPPGIGSVSIACEESSIGVTIAANASAAMTRNRRVGVFMIDTARGKHGVRLGPGPTTTGVTSVA